MIQVFYGNNNKKINITQTFINKFVFSNEVKIPKNTNFNYHFSDPDPGNLKQIIIKDSNGESIINEYDSKLNEIILQLSEKSMKRKIHFITYADDRFKNAGERICKEAENFNEFSSITFYKPKMLTSSFKQKYKDILNKRRGGGYWIWKWDIIKQKLDEIEENEFLVYLDAGCVIKNNGKERFNDYLDLLNNSDFGFISFQMPKKTCQEKKWTTNQIFKHLDIDINSDHANSGQICSTALIMKKNKQVYTIINKCLELLTIDQLLVTDHYNRKQNKFFIDNRHDQSLLSLVRKIYGSVVIDDDIGSGSKPSYHINPPFLALRKRTS